MIQARLSHELMSWVDRTRAECGWTRTELVVEALELLRLRVAQDIAGDETEGRVALAEEYAIRREQRERTEVVAELERAQRSPEQRAAMRSAAIRKNQRRAGAKRRRQA